MEFHLAIELADMIDARIRNWYIERRQLLVVQQLISESASDFRSTRDRDRDDVPWLTRRKYIRVQALLHEFRQLL